MIKLKFYLYNKVFLLAFLGSALTAYCQTPELQEAYIAKVLEERRAKVAEFSDFKTSPLDSTDVLTFTSLPYYQPDPQFKVSATVTRFKKQAKFRMPTSTDRLPEYKRWGSLTFSLADSIFTLILYQNLALIKKAGYEDYLFLPFTDLTNGETTYGGGRFLDFRIPTTDITELDFNAAYNPYCAYATRWSCPIPPDENHLSIQILAGEQKYHQGEAH